MQYLVIRILYVLIRVCKHSFAFRFGSRVIVIELQSRLCHESMHTSFEVYLRVL